MKAGNSYFAPRKRGTIVLFDSRTSHRVLKVTKGTRKSIVGWTVDLPVGSEVKHGRTNDRTAVADAERQTLELPGLVMNFLRRMDIL